MVNVSDVSKELAASFFMVTLTISIAVYTGIGL
jgi:hypothetical protein